ncbi:hypothetical protein [Dactylosporangium sp. NPDC049140]|uniref:hypothetical protein n=1 Tax=Dactylosporangium sp. NPDC049140 TaxID=3155647 RepID=UPI0034066489
MASEEMRNLRDQVSGELLGRRGITGVGIGAKVVDGRPIGQVAVTVFVEEKLPRAALAPGEMVPPDVGGVPTDVLVLRGAQPVAEPIGTKYPGDDFYADNERHRPITGGVAIRGDIVQGQVGTLGCLLHKVGDPTQVYGLTCHHVLARGEAQYNGLLVYQISVVNPPVAGKTICGQNDLATHSTCCPGIFGRYAGGAQNADWDAAVIRLDGGTDYRFDMRRASVPATGDLGGDDVAVAGIAPDPTDQQLGAHTYLVRKRGMRTGLTGGYVIAAHTDLLYPAPPPGETEKRVWAHDVLVVAPHPNPQVPAGENNHYLLEGDSGSVSMDTANRVLGLNFARAQAGLFRPPLPAPPPSTYFGVLFPINPLLAKFAAAGLNLTVGSATQPGQTHTVPGRPTVTSLVDDESVTVAVPEPVAALTAMGAPPPGVDRLGADLQATHGGRELLDFWRTHSAELRRLINRDRRVAAAWHRSGGSAVYQVLLRGAQNGTLRIPATVNGQPLRRCLDGLHGPLREAAGEPLRAALDRLHRRLPDLAGLTYPELLTALSRPTTN